MRWQDRALCKEVDPEIFYPEGSERPAKAICRLCEVRNECLDHALKANEEIGVWGGLGEKERAVLQRRRPWQRTPHSEIERHGEPRSPVRADAHADDNSPSGHGFGETTFDEQQ